ncbi:MAG TPA: DUF6186 family protein [Pilimelia sp.]|nr:DUF6186 family protein [Pilimelia sp.]
MAVLALFASVLAAGAVLQWVARREGSDVPTLGAVCAAVLAYEVRRVPVGRLGLLGFWWWIGWHFFAR